MRAILLVPGSILVALPALAQDAPPGWRHGPGMMWDGGWSMGWMFLGPLMMILFVAAIVVLVVVALRWLTGGGQGGGHAAPPPAASGRAPLDILKERFARGEIDEEEFKRRRRILEE